jgi:sugar phosphate isomerase/epimerase
VKIGLETISWGWHVSDMPGLVACAADLGFSGLEFAQNPRDLPPSQELKRLLSARSLAPIGLAGGVQAEMIPYCISLGAEYVCLDEWSEEFVASALEQGLTVAIHPHFFKEVDTVQAAAPHLKAHPRIGLILDTAHLFLSGEDIVACFNEYQDRILAIHLKDWSSRYGRSPHRFGRGFCALGEGQLGQRIGEFVSILQSSNYMGWLIIEQDTADRDPADCARTSHDWLTSRLGQTKG